MTNSERNDAIETLLQAASLRAEATGASLLEVAQAFLARAEAEKAERELTPAQRGYRDGCEGRRYQGQDLGYDDEQEIEYAEAYVEGEQYREDVRVDGVECDFLDGECSISGHYYNT